METKPIVPSGLGKPPAANPVMDVVTPPPAEQGDGTKHASDVDPLDKLAAEDLADRAQADARPKPQPKTAKPKHPHPADASGMNLAIIATVIIVLGLAALATYAYLQTAK